MRMKLSKKHRRAAFSALAIGLGMTLNSGWAAAAADSTKEQLLELTGGRRVKVVWNQGPENDTKLKLFDTKEGILQEIPFAGSPPLITRDGRHVLASTGNPPNDRRVMIYDTDTKNVTELAKGPGNNLLAVWTDPKTKRIWAYVNAVGDQGEAWNVPDGPIYRFPVDQPEARELFWDRTSSHFFLMFSEDGTHACLEPSWSNIGQLKLAFNADGTVNQDKSTYRTCGGGCFPSIAPDNSYRIFRLEGDHRVVGMNDADLVNFRKVKTDGMLTEEERAKNWNTWLTRWSTDVQFLTCVAPGNEQARIWMGRFGKDFNTIEQWVQVSAKDSPRCWHSQAWVEPEK